MAGCCTKNYINTFKTSIFCGVKGFLSFNLALLSYVLYQQHKEAHCTSWFRDDTVPRDWNIYAKYVMKRNLIPFIEMITIVPLVHFCITSAAHPMKYLLICAFLMTIVCYIVRTFDIREKSCELWGELFGRTKSHENEIKIKGDSPTDYIRHHDNQDILFYSSDALLCYSPNDANGFIPLIRIIVKAMQSCILLMLAAIELLETIPSFFVDIFYDKDFKSTRSNLQESRVLTDASIRNLPSSELKNTITKFMCMFTRSV